MWYKSSNVKELQSFLSMCNFLSKYSPQLAELSDDLPQLTCKDVHYNWGPEHTEAFNAIKKEITSPPVLSYYDPNKPLVLQTDASTKRIGCHPPIGSNACILCIKGTTTLPMKVHSHWIGSTSCQLGCWKCHQYLYGQQFTLETDQKPLVSILSKSLFEASPRMQWLLMKTVPYDMNVKYISGTTNTIADCLCRTPIKADTIQLPIVQVHQIKIISGAQQTDSSSSMRRLHKW